MIIEPKVREYICTTAHPQGCAESVRNQADYACKQGMVNGTKKALIIGCSTGYGLASRICALENCGADTLGIMFERQANGRRTATQGLSKDELLDNVLPMVYPNGQGKNVRNGWIVPFKVVSF